MPVLQYPPVATPPLEGQPRLFSPQWQRFFTDVWKTKGAAVKTLTVTGTQNDLVIGPFSVLRLNNALLLTITGLKGDAVDGQTVELISIGAGQVDLVHQSTGSSAAHRLINIATAAVTSLGAGTGFATYIYDGTAARWRLVKHFKGAAITTLTLTGTQNDVTVGPFSVLRLNNASLLTITGLAGDALDGQLVQVVSIGAGQVDLAHQNVGSAAANRLVNFATSAVTSLAAGSGTAIYLYDGTTARWRLLSHEQGAWISPAFAAGDFVGNGSMTWTVDSGDVVALAYYLKGRQLSVTFSVLTTTVGGTLNTQLRIAIPGGFTVAKTLTYLGRVRDNGVDAIPNLVQVEANVGYIENFANLPATGTNFSAATNNTSVQGRLTFEIT